MNPTVKQTRDGIIEAIKTNKTKGFLYRQPLTNDGFGGQIEDPTASPVPYPIICMISHERQGAFKNNQSPAGLATQFDRYLLVDYKIKIKENDRFTDSDNQNWRIGPVDVLKRVGKIIGRQAPIYKADNI